MPGTLAPKPVTSIDDPRYVKALSHPLRVRILALLQERIAVLLKGRGHGADIVFAVGRLLHVQGIQGQILGGGGSN